MRRLVVSLAAIFLALAVGAALGAVVRQGGPGGGDDLAQRNDALAATDGVDAWRSYLTSWTAGNHVRAAAGLLSAAALVNAVRVA